MKHEPLSPASWLHPQDCGCRDCERAFPAAPRRMSLGDYAGWMLGGIVTGNVLVFAWDWRLALHAWGFGS